MNKNNLWTTTERTCLHILEHKTKTKHNIFQIHAFMLRNSLTTNNNLIAKFLATCSSTGLIQHARKLFDKMPEPNDTYISNTMMKGYMGVGQFDECWCLYKDLRRKDGFRSDGYTFLTLAKMCGASLDVWGGEQVHDHVVKEGFLGDLYVATSLVDMYAKMGRVECAKRVFDEMGERSLVSWTALVGGYAKCGEIENARMYFDQMPKKDVE